MNPTTILYIILGVLIFEFLLTKIISYLNTLNWSTKLPKELKDIYDAKQYGKSMKYEKTKYYFSHISGTFFFIITYLLLVFGVFGHLDTFVRKFSNNDILLSLYFFGIILVFQTIFGIPFSYYSTFVIEEKFGFNKMSRSLFFVDTLKSFVLSMLIGGILLALVVWVYTLFGDIFWLYAWGIMTLFSICMMVFYSSIIVPLFNKQTPLKSGNLRNKIEDFALKVNFKLDNIFVIDGSKRSSKANAYFSGFGPKKRIVLYDTLIKDLTPGEVVGVLAHEIGHYKKKHTLQMLIFSLLQTGVILFIFSLILKYQIFSQALGASRGSFWVGAIAFGILFTPISMLLGVLGNILSRRNEYQADEFAAKHHNPQKLESALIKLSRNNLSNLRPHPIYEFFYYSHPTLLKRIKALRNNSG